MQSYPTWVRGLKLRKNEREKDAPWVAPYVGAWIETLSEARTRLCVLSHPTWVRGLKPIELDGQLQSYLSHPTWVRGLKQPHRVQLTTSSLSHPTWVRGLKQHSSDLLPAELESHPTWVRGLKQQILITSRSALAVAPYVGAWIETYDT